MKNAMAIIVASSIMFVPVAAAAQSQSAPGLSDLMGARGSSFETQMGSRGYTFVKKEGEAQFWWNGNSKTCVAATIANGRVDTLNSSSSGNCGHGGSGKTIAGVAAGAAAIGLIAALSHHHKKDDSRNNAGYNQEYERGYNDGMYGAHYAKQDSEAYHSGFMAGEAERNNRKHANSVLVSGAPASAQNACKDRGDSYWNVPAGSTVPVGVFRYDSGLYEVTVASGHRRAACTVDGRGYISGFAE